MTKTKKYIEISLSQVGVNEDSGILQEWFFVEGDFVTVGSIICEFETTKTAIEIEAEHEGYLLPVVEEKTEVQVGNTVALIIFDRNDLASIKGEFNSSKSNAEDGLDNGYKVTNKAKELIEKHKIDINSLHVGNKIIRANDVLSVIEQTQDTISDENIKIISDKESVVIYGAGKGASTLYEAISSNKNYNVVCFVDDKQSHVNKLFSLPVLHSSLLEKLREEGVENAACEIMNGKTRIRIKNHVEGLGFQLINVVHPKAFISDSVKMGNGNFIKSTAVIETNTIIGDCCIIDNGVIVAHDNQIGNGCHIAPGAALGSSISIKDFSVVGIGASISTNVSIGRNCIISAGTSVMTDIPDYSIVEGVPGKIVGKVKR